MAILEIRSLTKHFNGLTAIRDLEMGVFEGEILGLIGPNGAGKTTLFNIISGFLQPSKGTIVFEGVDITGLQIHKITQRGIARTFQSSELLKMETVYENIITALHTSAEVGVLREVFHTPAARREKRYMEDRALEILEFMRIAQFKDQFAGNLPHGHQRILGMCIALACNPKLLLLDEPVTGMNPQETIAMVNLIRKLRERGVTLIVVEHDMKLVMNLSDRIVVLNYGEKIAEGPPEEIRANKEVIEAYLGSEGEWEI